MSKQEIIDTKTAARVSDLEGTVVDMQNLADEALSQVDGVAHLALMAMETPDAYRFPESFAAAWRAVRFVSQINRSCLDGQAEAAGCEIRETAADRRMAARLAAKNYAE